MWVEHALVPATQEAEDHNWPEKKHKTSEKQMKATKNPEPGSSCRDLSFNLSYDQKSKTALKQTKNHKTSRPA
jgi:hypothetical protein